MASARLQTGKAAETSFIAYLNRGSTHKELKQYENTITDYTEAIALYQKDNDKANVYCNRGNTYNELKQYENAIADYTQAIARFANNNDKAKTHFNRGNVYNQLKQLEDAKKDYQKSVDLACECSLANYDKSVDSACEYSLVNYCKTETFYKFYLNKQTNTRTFYKFCPLNKHTFDMLKEQKLYFSDIASLNDPLECPFVQEVKFFRDTVFAEGTDYEPRILSLVLPCNNPKKCEKLPKELPVENYLLFFSHYAAAHTGICIEYQITKKFLQKNMFYKRVSYPETKRVQSIPELFAVKNKQWEYEHEARFVAFGKKRIYSTKIGVSITKIFFGLNTSKQNKKRLYKKIMKKQKNIEFFEAEKAEETLLNVKFVPYSPPKK